MLAVGEYIRTLREEQHLTQGQVIERLATKYGQKVSQSTFWRWESGQRSPRSTTLNGLIDVLGGSSADVSDLFNDPAATVNEGRNRAIRWLRRDQQERIAEIVETTSPKELDTVIEELRMEYRRNPSLLGYLRTFLAGWRGAAPRQ